MSGISRPRVRAPELTGRGGWINTGGKALQPADLRGRVVLLDFWTFCCVNCLHVIDELRVLEERFADELVIIGVHSPKFAHESEHAALVQAVERYEITHPVLDDPDLGMWQQYAVHAWPTLVVIDPAGYVVGQAAGEGHVPALQLLIERLVAEHAAAGTLRRGDAPFVPPPPASTDLRFPGKVVVSPTGTLLVADTRHHSIVEVGTDASTVLRRIGSGERGSADGTAGAASFAEPQSVVVLPAEIAITVGYDVLVADTANHRLRGIGWDTGVVSTVAVAPDELPLSPWDLAWWDGAVIVAAAGIHQLWRFDPVTGDFAAAAGTTTEGLRDGAPEQAWFAQPSGLAVCGDRLWVADAETSALRYLDTDGVHTAVGEGLFDFGHVDGPAAQARLQHPLGVAALADGSIAILDTYNSAVRRYDPQTDTVSTLATDVAEPSGAVLIDGELVVVESAAHRLTRPIAPGVMRMLTGAARQVARPVAALTPGKVRLEAVFTPAPGQHLDDRFGPASQLDVSASPPELLLAGAGTGTELTRDLRLAPGAGVLHVTARAAACDDGVEHPACHVVRQDWGVPIRTEPGAPDSLQLVLHGLPGDAG